MNTKLRRLGFLLLIAGGCGGSSQGDQVRHAQMEQVDERAEAQEESVDRQQSARDENLDQRYDKHEEAVSSRGQPGASASKEMVEMAGDRAKYHSDAQARLDKLGVRLNAAEQKLQILGPNASSTLHTSLKTASKEYDLLKQRVDQLPQTPADNWEAATEGVETQESELDERLSKIEDTLEDQE